MARKETVIPTGDRPEFLIDSIRIFRFQRHATMSIHLHSKAVFWIRAGNLYGEKKTKQKIEAS